ncbi:MAG: hypothetical protein FJ057_09375 [Cyanobacteria bacterium K_DeepCast_0m_m1_088]|nr:hypothetical protein [Cyanobacteria bacterium K_DeepCast_0m_m1_088]
MDPAILVLNAGSSSIKAALFDAAAGLQVAPTLLWSEQRSWTLGRQRAQTWSNELRSASRPGCPLR